MMLTLLVILLLFLLFIVNRIVKPFLLSPIYLYILFAVLSITVTVIYHYVFDPKISLFNLDYVSSNEFIAVIKLYLLALIAFLIGVIIFYDFSKKTTKISFNTSYSKQLFFKYTLPSNLNILINVLFIVIVVLYLITYKKGFFIRQDYLPETSRIFTILIKVLTFIEVILLGLLYHKNKIISAVLCVFLILLSLSTGSRSVFLFFVLYVSLVFISGGNTLFNKLRFGLHLLFAFVFLAYIMTLRTLESHGLIPYLKSIFSSEQSIVDGIIFNIYYSFIYGVYVTIETIKSATLDWHILWVNCNPLPGKLAGWYAYADTMRINIYVPYSLHGRVFKTGVFFSIVFFFVIGLIFAFFETKVRYFLSQGNRILAFVIVILMMLHIVYGFEYNMRAAMRYIYYAFFVVLMIYLTRQVIKNLPKQ